MSLENNNAFPQAATPPPPGGPANSTFLLTLLGFCGMLVLGGVVWIFLLQPAPQPAAPGAGTGTAAGPGGALPGEGSATDAAPQVPAPQPFRAYRMSHSGADAAVRPPPAATNAPPKIAASEKPPEKKADPDEEAVTRRFPNPLPVSAPVLTDKNFAATSAAKGKLPPPESGPLQQRIPRRLSRGAISAPASVPGGGALKMRLVRLTRDESLLRAGAVDALEAVYEEGDVPPDRVASPPRAPVAPSTNAGTNQPPKVPETNAGNPAQPAAPPLPRPTNDGGTSARTDTGADKAEAKSDGKSKREGAGETEADPTRTPAITELLNAVQNPGTLTAPVRYRVLAMPDESGARRIQAMWLSRFSFAAGRLERIERADKKEIEAIIFDASAATMGWSLIFWTNGNVANQVAVRGKLTAKEVFLMLPY